MKRRARRAEGRRCAARAKPYSIARDRRSRRRARDATTRGRARGARSMRAMIVHRLTTNVRSFTRAQQAQHRYPQGRRHVPLGKVQGEAAQVRGDD